ncbi:MAG: hypothetical protein WC735_02835 [Candidatus Paceibacterota bacterium]|jgi:hypothetical protein
MVKSLKIILLILVILLSGAFIFHYTFQSKSSPPATPLSSPLTDEQKKQALIDSITPKTMITSLTAQELKKLSDSIKPTTTTTLLTAQELKKLSDSIEPREQSK